MKKTMHIATAAVLAVLAWSCTEIVGLDESEGQEFTITASFAENRTKTTLQDGGTEVYWEPGDEVKLFYKEIGSRFTSTNTTTASVADFTGTLNVVVNFHDGFSSSTPLMGLYPYRSDASSDGKSITTTLPSEQTGKAGSFAKGMNLSLAKSPSLAMGFYNVCGGVRFSVTRADVKEVVFEALGGESVAGKVKLAFEEGVPVVQNVIEGQSSIALTVPDSCTFEAGKWYYIVALPGTLSGGFKMTFNTDSKYASLKLTDSKTIKRGIFGSLADADKDLIYKNAGNIVFKDSLAKAACVKKFDTNGDGELSYDEAAAVKSINYLFNDYKFITSFDELQYFTGITKMGASLRDLKRLKSVTIPAQFTSLEDNAFYYCSALDSVTFAGNEIKTIGDGAFHHCSSLKEISLPYTVETLGKYAFAECAALSAIDIPSKVTSIGMDAFSGCSSLKQIIVPEGVTSLGSHTFSGCKSLKTVIIPSTVSAIPTCCFSSCDSLISVSIPSGVTSIGGYAFQGVNMWGLELPSTITSLGRDCFGDIVCVIVPSDSLVTIMPDTFGDGSRGVGVPAYVVDTRAIYVPEHLIDEYKITTNWSKYSSRLHPLGTYTERSKYTFVTSGAADMGLSVKWAGNNVGANKPEDYGEYYAWGELETKYDYTWSTYRWYCGYNNLFSKYNEPIDTLTILELEDDVAHVKWGGNWRIPTNSEWKELIENCIWEWTTLNGINGYMVYGLENGKRIFLPAGGSFADTKNTSAGSLGYYWSSRQCYEHDRSYSDCAIFNSNKYWFDDHNRYYGCPVRPVTD